MTYKIINMVEKMKDVDDKMLEALFASEPLPDNGFSEKIVGRIRRRLWLRRLTLPTAVVVGGLIAVKPLLGLAGALLNLASLVPQRLVEQTAGAIPSMPTVVLGAMLLVVCLVGARGLED